MDIYNNIAKISLQHFSKLPKTGKPTENEWTILSTIVKDDRKMNSLEVVALGTGTKCIGVNQMSANGDILNDSHAEIICRRSFLKYLYFEIKACIAKNYKSDLLDFCFVTKKFSMKHRFKFHFFTTHVPCGDAAIFQKEENGISTTETDICSENIVHNPMKKIKLDYKNVDIYRTGAKCLPQGPLADPHDTSVNFHVVGVIRTKPGRGDPTLSVSCSDKIAKWCYLGIQGSLLSFLLVKPIYINSFTVAANTSS
ncbi:hypothetical protein AMK59_6626 [Oryctes borbonicus]|uniref:tRNA-specific adenosine deaminase 1 n=1 Tax=Oryctes borbonicus TaxID=1629725 RepID=A0A0T6AV05_9SCAR|nr:hypothetical protein AMK59_6626 [Oryctes borbonicus]